VINRVLGDLDLQEDLRKKGRELIKMYDWQKTAEVTYGVFKEILNR